MFISRETIDHIRNKANIVDIVHRYVPSLKKRGKNYIGLCPFHKENTPSFTVSPDKQIFHCFGCHEGGNVFSFVSKAERLDFNESVKFLADIVGVEIQEKARTQSPHLEKALKMNRAAMEVFHRNIKNQTGAPGLDYLTKRGVRPESIEDFKLGFAPDSWDFLVNLLRSGGVDMETAVSYGLISSSDKDGKKRYFDRFRNRVMFPIFDAGGKVVAFGGRVIGQGEPKYLNSPESDIFKKRYVLYGFHAARDHIRDLNRAIVVEGYLDVIACHQKGIKNVVAPLGTALTEDQLSFLSRYCTEVICIFDADSAGEAASLRTLSRLDVVNLDVKIGVLPKGQDPFDIVQKEGERAFMAVVDSAMKPTDYRLMKINDALPRKGKITSLLEAFAVVKSLPYETERNDYLKKISSMMNIDDNSVRRDFLQYFRGAGDLGKSMERRDQQLRKDREFLTRSYGDLMKLLCRYPALIDKASMDYTEEKIPDESMKKVFGTLVKLYFTDETFSVDKMFDIFNNGPEMDFLNECLNSDFTFEDPDAVYTEIYINMRLYEIDDKIDSFVNLVKANNDNMDEYVAEIEVLKREKEKLQNYLQNKHALQKHF